MDIGKYNRVSAISAHKIGMATSKDSSENQKLKRACADFESLFIYKMIQTMRKTIPESGNIHKISGKETYETMVDQKLAEYLASKGGLGLQGVLLRQLENHKQTPVEITKVF